MHPWLTRPLDHLAVRLPWAGLSGSGRSPVTRRLPPGGEGMGCAGGAEAVFGPSPPPLAPDAITSVDAGARTRRLSWPSPLPSGIPGNDTVRATRFEACRPGDALMILVPPWRASSEWPLRSRVRRLLAAGIDVLLYHPPFHLSRTPPGMRPGTPFLCWDLPGVLAAYRQAVTELVQIVTSRKSFAVERIGLLGLSLGAQITALVAARTDRPAAVALAAPPVDLAAIVRQTLLGRIYRDLLERSGRRIDDWWKDITRLSECLAPTSYSPAVAPARLLLAVGEHDLIVPPENSLALAARWHLAARRYRHGHISLVFWETAYLDELVRLIRRPS